MRSADVVVVATVQEVVSSDISVALGDTTYDMRKSPEEIAEFLVIESFQGSAPGAKLHTWMSTSTAFCGRSFVLGATYLLYLRHANRFGYSRAGLCSRTKLAEGADQNWIFFVTCCLIIVRFGLDRRHDEMVQLLTICLPRPAIEPFGGVHVAVSAVG